MFQTPTTFDEFYGQPIQQFRMRGCHSLHAKVSRCLHKPPAKMLSPNAIDNDPRGQRILRVSQSLCQRQASPTGGDITCLNRNPRQVGIQRDNTQTTRLQFLSCLIRVTSEKQVSCRQTPGFFGDRPNELLLWFGRTYLSCLCRQFLEFVSRLAIIQVQRTGGDIQVGMLLEQLVLLRCAFRCGSFVRSSSQLMHRFR